MRPASWALGAAALICVLGVIANVSASNAFAAAGGWVTVVVILILVPVWAGLSIVRRTNRNAARMSDGSSSRPEPRAISRDSTLSTTKKADRRRVGARLTAFHHGPHGRGRRPA